ncbi:transmembrane protein 45b [Phtheirospermum japonicum]|uniref:Transmembrane protein 45b n=1 Tax=Phtheirospermum japonicum TaxID=374723 RepID=A0A830BES1_9LAMI|nr:transmembrane protein 45b [Phtheirospermum japonicum]
MGTFIGHLVPGLALTFLGLWHTINTVRAYFLKGPNKFTLKFWHPLKTPLCKLEHLELILVLSFSVFAILAQILDVKNLRFSFELDNIEHATIFLSLIIFTSFTLFTELTHLSANVLEISGILVTSVFGQELFLLHYHSTDHVGLEGHYHWLMQLVVCVSFLAALYATTNLNSFLVALILSISIVFQGCWFINMGFVLWVPSFVPLGCVDRPMGLNDEIMHGAVVCGTQEADLRARALANLQFCWILSLILIFVASICVVFGRQFILRRQSVEYEQLSSRGTHDTLGAVGCKQIQL